MIKKSREPLFRITRKSNVSGIRKILYILACVAVAVLISILFIFIVSQKNPFEALKLIFEGTFHLRANGTFNTNRFGKFLTKMILLLAVALALTPAYKMKFWNIGGRGQILMGGLATAACMIYLRGKVPSWAILVISGFSGTFFGAIWGYIPAIFKSKWQTNETLFTLMMNYIAAFIVIIFYNFWKGDRSNLGQINSAGEEGYFPIWKLTDSGPLNSAIIPALIVAFLVFSTFIYLRYTKHGFEILVVGDSTQTAKYIGINVGHVLRRTMLVSGAICGFVGFLMVSNFDYTISSATDQGFGFTAIIVCWLANFNPFAMVGYSSLISFLNVGAENLKSSGYSPNLNEYSSEFISFVIILAFMLGHFFGNYTIQFRKNPNRFHNLLLKGIELEEVTNNE